MTRAGFAFGWDLGLAILAVWAGLIAVAAGWCVLDWHRERARVRRVAALLDERDELAAELERAEADQLAHDADELHRLRFYDPHDWGVRG